MATVQRFRYPIGGSLAPNAEQAWTIGPWDPTFDGSAVLDAHPFTGPGSQYPQALSVSFQQTSVDPVGRHYIDVRFRNTGTTPIAGYTFWLTVFTGL